MFHPDGPTFWELAEQCLSSTERGYDLLAPKFDRTPFRTPDEILDRLAPLLGPPQSIGTALDVCCGTGAAIRILRPLCHRRVVGIDFSRGMLEVARRHFPDQPGQPPVEFVQGDVLNMSLRNEFDLAITVGSLGHILPRDQARFIERIAAALRPGGRFVFLTIDKPPWWSRQSVLSRGFNLAMHVRNALKRPPFVMFYLQFLLPGACRLLALSGFDVTVHGDVFADQWRKLKVVVAARRPG